MGNTWTQIGSLQATSYWQEFDLPLTSRYLKVTFTGAVPSYPNEIRGFFRLRYDAETFSGKWFRVYPKLHEKEVYVLDTDFFSPFEDSIKLQFRRWLNRSAHVIADWAITVENLVAAPTETINTLLAFGLENVSLHFGAEPTYFV